MKGVVLRKPDRFGRWMAAFVLLAVAAAPAAAQTLLRGPGSAAFDPMFEKVLEKPNEVELNLAFARRAIELEDFEAAVATLERLLIGRSGLPLIRLELGMLYLRLEAPELAEAYFLQVTEAADVPEEARERAQVLLAETRSANSRNSFSFSVSLGAKHNSNAVSRSTPEHLAANARLTTENQDAGEACYSCSFDEDYYRDNAAKPDSDASMNGSLAVSYSRELDGLTERRFNASLSHYMSLQSGEKLESLDIAMTSLRAGWVLPLQRQGRLPLSFGPYLSASTLTTKKAVPAGSLNFEDVNNYAVTGALGLTVNGFLRPQNPIALAVEAADKSHEEESAQGGDGGRYFISLTLGHTHAGGGYSSAVLKFDRTDAVKDHETLNGGALNLSHNLTWGGTGFGVNLGWRESRRDGFMPAAPGDPQIEKLRYDQDLTAGLSMSRTMFGVAVSLSGGYTKRHSNLPGSKYEDTNASLNFSRSFQ